MARIRTRADIPQMGKTHMTHHAHRRCCRNAKPAMAASAVPVTTSPRPVARTPKSANRYPFGLSLASNPRQALRCSRCIASLTINSVEPRPATFICGCIIQSVLDREVAIKAGPGSIVRAILHVIANGIRSNAQNSPLRRTSGAHAAAGRLAARS